jgi:hypothetical protein
MGMPMMFVDYQALLQEKIPYERAVPTESRVAVCEPNDPGRKPTAADMPTMLPQSHLGVMAVVGDRGMIVPVLTASDLLRKLKALWNDTQD